jgi:hypothetical protein
LADITTIAELGTASGTLVLAIATFGATRSANRSARIGERSLLLGLRPLLVPSRAEDRTERVDFALESRTVNVPGGSAAVLLESGLALFAIALRNVGAGPALLQGWHVDRGLPNSETGYPDLGGFVAQRRDLYVSPGDTGFWQGAVRETSDPLNEEVREALEADDALTVHLLYSDVEGGQRFVSMFALRPEDSSWTVAAGRHWALD